MSLSIFYFILVSLLTVWGITGAYHTSSNEAPWINGKNLTKDLYFLAPNIYYSSLNWSSNTFPPYFKFCSTKSLNLLSFPESLLLFDEDSLNYFFSRIIIWEILKSEFLSPNSERNSDLLNPFLVIFNISTIKFKRFSLGDKCRFLFILSVREDLFPNLECLIFIYPEFAGFLLIYNFSLHATNYFLPLLLRFPPQ